MFLDLISSEKIFDYILKNIDLTLQRNFFVDKL